MIQFFKVVSDLRISLLKERTTTTTLGSWNQPGEIYADVIPIFFFVYFTSFSLIAVPQPL